MFLTSGAKGTRTPDPLLANNRQTVHPRPYPQVTVLPRPSKAARVHTGCGTSVLYTYKPQREGLDVRAPLVPGQRPRVGCSVRQFNEAPRVIGRHVTEPEEHRRRARGQELLQRCGRAPGCWPLRPPVARYLIAVRPVRRARHNCRAEAVEDRPAPGVRRAYGCYPRSSRWSRYCLAAARHGSRSACAESTGRPTGRAGLFAAQATRILERANPSGAVALARAELAAGLRSVQVGSSAAARLSDSQWLKSVVLQPR